MSQLSSKLHKNLYTDISLGQIYLPKLHENILKYYSWIYLKKSPLASTTASKWLLNLLQAFLTISLFKLVNASIILAFIPFIAQLAGAVEYSDCISAER